MLDILIQNATIVDGSGAPAYTGNVGIVGGKLVMSAGSQPAKTVIDAAGRILCPGFIDAHSHGDHILGQQDSSLFKTAQGITTELCGNCGDSVAPVNPEKIGIFPMGRHDPEDVKTWTSFERFLRYAEGLSITSNARFYVGHHSLRKTVMGRENRQATPRELDTMKGLLREAMESGAAGFSTGLIYAPGSYANDKELTELAKVIEPFGGVYTTHIRNESERLVESVEEAIAIGRHAGVRVDISHHKAAGRPNWGKTKTTLELIRKANEEEGLHITCDQYPYTRNMTGLSACMSSTHLSEGPEALAEKLKDPAFRAAIRKEMEDPTSPYDNFYLNSGGWDGVFVCTSEKCPEATGLFISQYAQKIGKDPWTAYFDFMVENNCRAWAVYSSMCEEDLCDVIRSPYCVVGTDGCTQYWDAPGHPRSSSTFPHAICHFVKEKKILTLEQMIHKMTGLTAQRLYVANKGLLKDGFDADLVIFDYDRLQDTGTFTHAHKCPEGIDYVIVNGEIVYRDMAFTGIRSGKILLHNWHK